MHVASDRSGRTLPLVVDMGVTLVRPSADLQTMVRHFRIGEARLTETEVRWPLPARPEQFLEFYLADPYRVVSVAGGPVSTVAPVVVVGPQTARREDLVLNGTLRVFTIHFLPTGFHQLFGIPMLELANRTFSAEDVVGREVLRLHARLQETGNDLERVELAESFLRARAHPPLQADPVRRAADEMLASHGQMTVRTLAGAVGLSVRQLERRFLLQIGLSPKMLGRVTRLQRALHLRQERPGAGWARIAVEAGYYDQMHLVKEFHLLAGESPARLMESIRAADQHLRWNG